MRLRCARGSPRRASKPARSRVASAQRVTDRRCTCATPTATSSSSKAHPRALRAPEMCGRYTLHTEKEALARRFALDPAELEVQGAYAPRYNVAPTQPVLALVEREGRLRALQLRWGLVPHWTAADAPLPSWINARAESAATRPAFRDAFARHRCLIPASGFYEWEAARGAGRRRIPHWIARRDGEPFAMAGIWAR